MRRYLVVANRTLAGRQLLERVREYRAVGSCWFYVVVPVSGDATTGTTDPEAEARARVRLAGALARLRAEGASAAGEVVGPDPVDAVRDVLERVTVDELIVATLPPGQSAWNGLAGMLASVTGLPVEHVECEGEPEPAGASR
jgi:hypothetical protein